MTSPPIEDLAAYGHELHKTRWLEVIRKQLGLSRNFMAEILDVSPGTVRVWESGDGVLREGSARRLGSFSVQMADAMARYHECGYPLERMCPAYEYGANEGRSAAEVTAAAEREGLTVVDLGVLGPWVVVP